MSQMLKAGYKCKKCGADESFDVRARASDEGIENYVYHVARRAGERHQWRMCSATEVDLKVPITSNGIGYPGESLTEEQLRELNRDARQPPESP